MIDDLSEDQAWSGFRFCKKRVDLSDSSEQPPPHHHHHLSQQRPAPTLEQRWLPTVYQAGPRRSPVEESVEAISA